MSDIHEMAVQELDMYIVERLHSLTNRIQTVGNNCIDGITWKQLLVLKAIQRFEEDPSISILAEALETSHQNIKQILLKLEDAGFVELYKDAQDRRKICVRMTERIHDFNQRHEQEKASFMEAMYMHISRDQMINMLETMLQMEENLQQFNVQFQCGQKPLA